MLSHLGHLGLLNPQPSPQYFTPQKLHIPVQRAHSYYPFSQGLISRSLWFISFLLAKLPMLDVDTNTWACEWNGNHAGKPHFLCLVLSVGITPCNRFSPPPLELNTFSQVQRTVWVCSGFSFLSPGSAEYNVTRTRGLRFLDSRM